MIISIFVKEKRDGGGC